jgi:hypothetical protein
MPRSSISSSERRPRAWRRYLLIVLATLGAAEAALRLPQVRHVLPARTHYYHPAIARRIDAIDRVKLAHGRVDVLFIGSSIVLTNVHPLLFDSVAARHPGQLVSFNAALMGLWPTGVHLYAEHVWLPLTRPRLVVQGVRYGELAATTHAKHDTQVWSGKIEPAWRDADLGTRLYAEAVSRVSLLQYHGTLTRELQRFRGGWRGAPDDEDADGYSVRGYVPRGAPTVAATGWTEDLPNTGTCEARRCEVGFGALRRTIAAARASGAAYVLVNVPEHPARWRGPGARHRYRHYLASLRAFVAAEGVALVDPTDGDPLRFEKTPYNDYSHMTAAGSRQFTRELALRMAPLVARTFAEPREMRARGEGALTPAGVSGRRGPG